MDNHKTTTINYRIGIVYAVLDLLIQQIPVIIQLPFLAVGNKFPFYDYPHTAENDPMQGAALVAVRIHITLRLCGGRPQGPYPTRGSFICESS